MTCPRVSWRSVLRFVATDLVLAIITLIVLFGLAMAGAQFARLSGTATTLTITTIRVTAVGCFVVLGLVRRYPAARRSEFIPTIVVGGAVAWSWQVLLPLWSTVVSGAEFDTVILANGLAYLTVPLVGLVLVPKPRRRPVRPNHAIGR